MYLTYSRPIVHSQILDFMDLADALHVSRIMAITEYDRDTCAWIDVGRREVVGGINDERPA